MVRTTKLILFLLVLALFGAACSSGTGSQLAAVPTQTTRPTPTAEPAETVVAPAIGDTAVAYIQDGNLYLRDLALSQPAVLVDECPAPYCFIQYPKWSPNGQFLLYFRASSAENGSTSALYLADRQGRVQLLQDNSAYMRPGEWSPDGRSIAYLEQTDQWIPDESDGSLPPGNLFHVWTIAVSERGKAGDRQLVGDILLPEGGCGGGGRSRSDELYENEGGTAYGYQMAKTEWTAANILFYTLNCTNVGIGRFDMASGQQLEPFPVPLRNLVLTPARDRWVAAVDYPWSNTNQQLATGDAAGLEISYLPVSDPVELVYVGAASGRIYYTSREVMESNDLFDRSDLPFPPVFNFFHSTVWVLEPDGQQERIIWEAADNSFANLAETVDGSLLLVRVENDTALHEAVRDNNISLEKLVEYYPQRHIVLLSPSGPAQPWLDNAGLLTLSR